MKGRAVRIILSKERICIVSAKIKGSVSCDGRMKHRAVRFSSRPIFSGSRKKRIVELRLKGPPQIELRLQ